VALDRHLPEIERELLQRTNLSRYRYGENRPLASKRLPGTAGASSSATRPRRVRERSPSGLQLGETIGETRLTRLRARRRPYPTCALGRNQGTPRSWCRGRCSRTHSHPSRYPYRRARRNFDPSRVPDRLCQAIVALWAISISRVRVQLVRLRHDARLIGEPALRRHPAAGEPCRDESGSDATSTPHVHTNAENGGAVR
jgi:hypothetical protein